MSETKTNSTDRVARAAALDEMNKLLAEFAAHKQKDETRVTATEIKDTHILVVDDDPFICRVLARIVGALGANVQTAENMTRAVDLFEPKKFDVVITDLHMPDGKGTELLAYIRNIDPPLPVILLTASPTIEHAMDAVEFRAWRFLQKPFDNAALERLIGEAVSYSRISRVRHEIEKTMAGPLELSERFERALRSFWIARQKIVDKTEGLRAFEVLTRCEESLLMQPEAFFLLADAIGRVQELGRAVRQETADLMLQHPHELFFVNLHPGELEDPWLFDERNPLLKHSDRVIFELNERASGETIESVLPAIKSLRAQGFRFAVDDLGAPTDGQGSFLSIHPSLIKLDGSLVQNIDKETVKRMLITRLMKTCKTLNIEVMAESVETRGEFEALHALGVRYFQGFLFGRPVA